MLSARQIMNTSFDPLNLVNTYGAFGSVGRERLNVVFEGTDADNPYDPNLAGSPIPTSPCPWTSAKCLLQIAPYQPRLDWQMWFASMATPQDYPWTLHLVWKLLHNDPEDAWPVREKSLPGYASEVCARHPLSLSIRFTGQSRRRLVDARRIGRVAPAVVERRSAAASHPAASWLDQRSGRHRTASNSDRARGLTA